ncbi:MAG: thymidylate synthase, partial [Nitrospiria bacterium]
TPKTLPEIKVTKKNVLDIRFEDIELCNYQHHPFIKFPIAV